MLDRIRDYLHSAGEGMGNRALAPLVSGLDELGHDDEACRQNAADLGIPLANFLVKLAGLAAAPRECLQALFDPARKLRRVWGPVWNRSAPPRVICDVAVDQWIEVHSTNKVEHREAFCELWVQFDVLRMA